MIQIARDNAGDHSIMSGDVVQSVGDGLGYHGYDTCAQRLLVSSMLSVNRKDFWSYCKYWVAVHCTLLTTLASTGQPWTTSTYFADEMMKTNPQSHP